MSAPSTQMRKKISNPPISPPISAGSLISLAEMSAMIFSLRVGILACLGAFDLSLEMAQIGFLSVQINLWLVSLISTRRKKIERALSK